MAAKAMKRNLLAIERQHILYGNAYGHAIAICNHIITQNTYSDIYSCKPIKRRERIFPYYYL